MAIVGHFESLAEAQKLVNSDILAGVVQETYEEGQLLQRLPVTTIDSKSLLYNRESTLPCASFFDIHEQIPWTADVDFVQKEATLKIVARQDVLDRFMMKTYKNPNDYRSIILSTLRKGVMRTVEDKLIYGNIDNDSAEFDGLGHLLPADISGSESWAAANPQAYDMGGASTAITMTVARQLIDRVRPKPSILLMTRTMRNTMSATAFEKGIVLSSAGIGAGHITYSKNEFGSRIDYFDGIPIVISDYLGGSYGETDNTVNKATSASGICSIWALRFGSLIDGGITLVTGGDTGGVDLFRMTELEDLEDYDAGGIRLVAYCSLAQGSSKASAVVHSIDEDGVIIG
jgi:hypothetical protein